MAASVVAYTRSVLSVRDLRSMARTMPAQTFQQQLGPFVLIQRPPEQLAQMMSMQLGAKRTMMKGTRLPQASGDFLLEMNDLMVATLPPLKESEELTVGRLLDCELVIDDPSVSKRHAVLRWDSRTRQCYLTDLGSTNGTLLNGNALRRSCATGTC